MKSQSRDGEARRYQTARAIEVGGVEQVVRSYWPGLLVDQDRGSVAAGKSRSITKVMSAAGRYQRTAVRRL